MKDLFDICLKSFRIILKVSKLFSSYCPTFRVEFIVWGGFLSAILFTVLAMFFSRQGSLVQPIPSQCVLYFHALYC